MKKILGIAIMLSLAAAGTAVADDFNPPSWRGLPNTLTVGYNFTTEANLDNGHYYPEWDFYQRNFTPDPQQDIQDPVLDILPGPGAGWYETVPGYDETSDPRDNDPIGWYNLSGELWLDLPNTEDQTNHKEIWIQITYSPQDGAGENHNVPIIEVTSPTNPTKETTSTLVYETLYENFVEDEQVVYSVYHIDLPVNPPYEEIYIRGGIDVGQLVVDTWCTPEPASMGILAIGGLAVMVRRRRRK